MGKCIRSSPTKLGKLAARHQPGKKINIEEILTKVRMGCLVKVYSLVSNKAEEKGKAR